MKALGYLRLVILAAVWIAPEESSAQPPRPKPKIIWQRYFGLDDTQYTEVAMALSPKRGDVWICARTNAPGPAGRVSGLHLWRISQDGQLIAEMPVPTTMEGRPLNVTPYETPALAAQEDGGLLLVVNSHARETLVLRLDDPGNLRRAKEIADLGSVHHLSLVATPDRKHLFMAAENEDAFVMKMDSEGNELWRRRFDGGKIGEWFESAVPTEDEGFVFVGWSHNEFSPSDVWLVKCDGQGRKQAQKFFPGLWPSGCKAPNGRLGVVYKKEADSGVMETWVKALTLGLEELWTSRVSAAPLAIVSPKIACLPDGGFVIGDVNLSVFWVARLDRQGRQVWMLEDARDELSRISCRKAVVSHDNVFILNSVVFYANQDKSKEPREQYALELIKLRP